MNASSVTNEATHSTPLWESIVDGFREDWKSLSLTALETARDTFLNAAHAADLTAGISSASLMRAEKMRDMADAADCILIERYAAAGREISALEAPCSD